MVALINMRELSRTLLFVTLVACSLPALSHPLAAQSPAPRVSLVSDWTLHHVVFRASPTAGGNEKNRRDPRWTSAWYRRHPAAMWPGYHPTRTTSASNGTRDWNVTLGNANFAPTYDGTFLFSLCCGVPSPADTGYGSLSAINIGSGEMLATQGSLTVTGTTDGEYTGPRTLYPGGPSNTWAPSDQFSFDNVLYPSASRLLDAGGLLFVNSAGLQTKIWGNSATSYGYEDWNGLGLIHDNSGSEFTLKMSAAPDPGGGQTFPAKYVFNVNTTPSCSNDFVVIGVPANPAAGGQANIIGFNNLYTTDSGTGFCGGTAPKVMFAYASGTGQVPASVTLSMNGQQIAFVENLATSSLFHVLTIGTSGTNGSVSTQSAVPGAGGDNNAVDQSVLLSPDGGVTTQSSTSAAFVDYANCAAYVTTYSAATNSGYLFKIANIFGSASAPAILWSLPIDAIPSGPVLDSGSDRVFFTDSLGRIDYATEATGSPVLFYGPTVAPGATSLNPVVIDDSDEMVYATFNSNGTNAVVVQASNSLLSWVATPVGNATTTFTSPYTPDFNNAWYTGVGTPLLYVAGTGTGTLPTLYSIGFNAEGVMNSSAGGQTAALATGTADSSSVTEFYNAAQQEDYLFVGVTNNCIASTEGGTAGCAMSLNITNGFPTVNAGSTSIAASGGTTGIIVDNESSLTESSSIYYATKSGATLVKATQNGLN